MNMGKLCVFATLWHVWHGNTIETHANFEITCFQCFFFFFFFLVFAPKCAIDDCFAINLVQKDDLVFFRGERGLRAKVARLGADYTEKSPKTN